MGIIFVIGCVCIPFIFLFFIPAQTSREKENRRQEDERWKELNEMIDDR